MQPGKLLEFQVLNESIRVSSKMNLDEQISYYSSSIPGHLKGIVYAGCPELGLGDGGHGEQIAIGFRLRCTCGHELFEVTAYELPPENRTLT